MSLVERSDHMELLRQAYAECSQGGRLAVISAPVTVGKTALLHAFLEWAGDEGAVRVTAAAAEQESALGLSVLRQIARSLTTAGGPETALADPAARPDGTDDAAATDELSAALTELARDRTVVVAVDDVQYADERSLQGLLYLQRRLHYARVLFVLTEQGPYGSLYYAAFRAQLTRHPFRRFLKLGLLTERGVTELLEELLGAEGARRLAPSYHRITGGNPLLLWGLIGDRPTAPRARDAEEGPERVPVGPEFRQAVLTYLHRLGPVRLNVARGVAALQDRAEPGLLGELLDLPEHEVRQALGDLQGTGLLDDGRFRHPGAAEAALDGIHGTERGRFHLRAAELLHLHGASAEQVAAQLVSAHRLGVVPAEEWAFEVLRHTAHEAIADEDFARARERLSVAERSGGGDEGRLEVTNLLLQTEWHSKPAGVTRYVDLLREANADGRLQPGDALPLAKALLWYGQLGDLTAVMKAMVQTWPGDPRRSDAFGLVLFWVAFLCPGALKEVDGLDSWARAAEEPGTPWARAIEVIDLLRRGGPRERLLTGAEEVLRSTTLTESTFELQVSALTALIFSDHTSRAETWCVRMLASPLAVRAPVWRATLTAMYAVVLLRRGELCRAEEEARLACELVPPQGWGTTIGLPLSVRIAALTGLGRHEMAASLIRMPVPEAMPETLFGQLYLYERGLHHLAVGQAHSAVEDFERCRSALTEWQVELPRMVPWRVGLAEGRLRMGRREEARRLASEQLSVLGTGVSRSRGLALRTLALCSEDAAETVRGLRQAADGLEASGDCFEASRTLRHLCRSYELLGDSEQARAAHRRATQLAEQVTGDGRVSETEGRDGRKPSAERQSEEPAWHRSLSRAELKVAALAAMGYTNREIEEQLFITVSTVEQHLTRVYRKLDVRSRGDLPPELRRYAPQPAHHGDH